MRHTGLLLCTPPLPMLPPWYGTPGILISLCVLHFGDPAPPPVSRRPPSGSPLIPQPGALDSARLDACPSAPGCARGSTPPVARRDSLYLCVHVIRLHCYCL